MYTRCEKVAPGLGTINLLLFLLLLFLLLLLSICGSGFFTPEREWEREIIQEWELEWEREWEQIIVWEWIRELTFIV
jgi:hypothetical protein